MYDYDEISKLDFANKVNRMLPKFSNEDIEKIKCDGFKQLTLSNILLSLSNSGYKYELRIFKSTEKYFSEIRYKSKSHYFVCYKLRGLIEFMEDIHHNIIYF